MKLKAVILAACLGTTVAAGSAFAFAGKEHRAADPAKRAEHLQKTLQLDDAQRLQVQKILEDSRKQREALAQKYKIAERDAFVKDVKALHEKNHEQINALLTPAQREALEAQKARHGKFHKHGPGKHHRGEAKPAA
jgi:Skp family chaperone for outer membrane proteins